MWEIPNNWGTLEFPNHQKVFQERFSEVANHMWIGVCGWHVSEMHISTCRLLRIGGRTAEDQSWGVLHSSLDVETSPATYTASSFRPPLCALCHFLFLQLFINLTHCYNIPSALRAGPLPLAGSLQCGLHLGPVSLPFSQLQGQEDNPALLSQIVDFFSHPTLPAGGAFLCPLVSRRLHIHFHKIFYSKRNPLIVTSPPPPHQDYCPSPSRCGLL